MPEFSNNWFEQHIPQWTAIMQRRGWDGSQPLTGVEIGSFEGRSTLWTLENPLRHPESRMYCIDTFEGGIEHSEEQTTALWERFCRNIAGSPHAGKVEVRRKLSRLALIDLLGAGVAADFVYVDGSHQAADVLEDLVLSFRLLKVGGLMICDDYLWFMERPDRRDVLNAPKIAIDAFVNINLRKISLIGRQQLYQLAFTKLSD